MTVAGNPDMKYRDFKPGETYRADIGGYSNYKIHIVRVIDEGLFFCPIVVYRYYGTTKQWWHYETDNAYSLTGGIERAEKTKDLPRVKPGGF